MSNVDQLLYLMDEAFEDGRSHSLLRNLHSVAEEDWEWTPPGGHRSIRQIVGHVGACKYMYENHAFGDGTLTWADPLAKPPEHHAAGRTEPILQWLREGHRRLRESVAKLSDDDLQEPRKTNWGEPAQTRWIIKVTIEHDLYHAGEINHLRALRQDDDHWPDHSS